MCVFGHSVVSSNTKWLPYAIIHAVKSKEYIFGVINICCPQLKISFTTQNFSLTLQIPLNNLDSHHLFIHRSVFAQSTFPLVLTRSFGSADAKQKGFRSWSSRSEKSHTIFKKTKNKNVFFLSIDIETYNL